MTLASDRMVAYPLDAYFPYINTRFTVYLREIHYSTMTVNLSTWNKCRVLQEKLERAGLRWRISA